jgi:hypothetical protein
LIGGAVVQDESVPAGRPYHTLHLPKNVHVIIEMKYGSVKDRKNSDAELNALVKKAATAIRRKNYGIQYEKTPGNVIKIAMGVFGRGDVKILFLD